MLRAKQHDPKSQNLTICLRTIPQVCLTIHHPSSSLSPINAPQIVIMCYTAKKNHKSCKMPTNQKHWFYEDVMCDNARQNNNAWCQPNAQVPHYDVLYHRFSKPALPLSVRHVTIPVLCCDSTPIFSILFACQKSFWVMTVIIMSHFVPLMELYFISWPVY